MPAEDRGRYQILESGMFSNRKFRGLSDSAFLFFHYLIQYEKNNCAGIFRATASQLSADSEDRWTPAKCREFTEALVKANLVRADGDWIWVIGSFKRVARNPKAYASARRGLIRCRSRRIFDEWFTKYSAMDNVDKWVGPVTFRGEADPEAVLGDPEPLEPIPGSPNLMAEAVDSVWAFYQQTMVSHADLTPKRKKKILLRLHDTIFDPQTGNKRRVTTGDLMLAIANCTKSDWHMGRDPKTNGHRYNALEDHILASTEQLEKWLRYEGPGSVAPATPRPLPETLSKVEGWRGKQAGAEEVKGLLGGVLRDLQERPPKEEVFDA